MGDSVSGEREAAIREVAGRRGYFVASDGCGSVTVPSWSDVTYLLDALSDARRERDEARREGDQALRERDEWLTKTQAMGEGRIRAETALSEARRELTAKDEALREIFAIAERIFLKGHPWNRWLAGKVSGIARRALAGSSTTETAPT
jgi:hypothetical protein